VFSVAESVLRIKNTKYCLCLSVTCAYGILASVIAVGYCRHIPIQTDPVLVGGNTDLMKDQPKVSA
jgi:hypothetical protein